MTPRLRLRSLLSAAAASAVTLGGCATVPAVPEPPATTELLVAATTDQHGRLRGWDYYQNAPDPVRGLARAATIVDSLRTATGGRVVLVDAGDLLQGNPLTHWAARVGPQSGAGSEHPVAVAMNAMRYDAATIGNHEFNYGLPLLERVIREARFPFLAANAYTAAGARAFPSHVLVDRGGVKVAIVGATTPGSMVWDRDNLAGRLVVRDIVPEMRRAVEEARAAGAHVVVASLHSGLDEPSSYDERTTGLPAENVSARVALEVPGIDVLIVGHSHREIADTTIGGVLVMQPRNWATSLSVGTLSLARQQGRWRVVSKRGQVLPLRGRAEHPAVLSATQRAHDGTVSYVTTPIGTTAVRWRADSARVVDTPILDFMLEVMRRAAGADLAASAMFSLDADLGPGAITVADVAALYPYDNSLRAVRVSGAQLREYLEYSARYFAEGGAIDRTVPGYNFDVVAGADYTIDISRPVGQRITKLLYKGRPVAPSDSFTLALNNYRQTGGGGFAMLAGAPVVHDQQLDIRQLLIDEVRRRGELRPADYHAHNWEIVPAALGAAAYSAMRGDARSTVRTGAAGARLRIIGTNDFHGAFEARPDAQGVQRGGARAMAGVIARARHECQPPECHTLLLDGGDMFQGTVVSNLAFGEPVVALYDTLGFAAAALGNHEFDWGVDTLRARMRQARYAILGANVRYSNGRDVEWVRNDTIVQRGPWKVGIIGISTEETPTTTKRTNVVGLRFDPPAPIVDSLARSLRARGAQAVVVIAHAGAFCQRDGATDCKGEIVNLAQNVREPIDAIVSGHLHTIMDVVVNGIPIVQARTAGRAVAVLDLPMPRPAARLADGPSTAEVRDVIADSVQGVPAVDRLVASALAKIAPLVSRRIAQVAEPMRRTGDQYALGNLIADGMRWAAKSDVAVMNNGGIRADLQAGVATYGSLFEIQPFGNTLVRMTMTGRNLVRSMERAVARTSLRTHVSGVRITYDPAKPEGQRIVTVRSADGTPFHPDSLYTLTVNDFMATGGDELGPVDASRTQWLDVTDIDATIAYLQQLPQPVRPPADRRITAVSRP